MSEYTGDYTRSSTVYRLFSTNKADGTAIDRSTTGAIVIYRDGSTTRTSTGVTDTGVFNSKTGLNALAIVTTHAFYTAGSDYDVILEGAKIDGKTVNGTVFKFSVENRFNEVDITKVNGVAKTIDDFKTSTV
jgi:hypothetical protein